MAAPTLADLQDAAALLARMEGKGLRVEVRGGRLYVGPQRLLTDRLSGEIAELKQALIAHLAPPAKPDPLQEAIAGRRRALIDDGGHPVCPDCGGRALADGIRTCPACHRREQGAA